MLLLWKGAAWTFCKTSAFVFHELKKGIGLEQHEGEKTMSDFIFDEQLFLIYGVFYTF